MTWNPNFHRCKKWWELYKIGSGKPRSRKEGSTTARLGFAFFVNSDPRARKEARRMAERARLAKIERDLHERTCEECMAGIRVEFPEREEE